MNDLMALALTGTFTLAAGLGGVYLSGWVTQRRDAERIRAEDERRWLGERRNVYSRYLGLAASMLQEVDRVALLTLHRPDPAEDEQRRQDLYQYFNRWDEELQPALGEVQLIGNAQVVDIADRVSAALMELTSTIELRGSLDDHYPAWFQTKDLVEVLKNSMRDDLGLDAVTLWPRTDAEWPWLADRPARESYVQVHSHPAGKGSTSDSGRGESDEKSSGRGEA